MTDTEPLSDAATRYLRELRTALDGVPADVRSEMVDDVEGQLRGLNEEAATRRIAELGDPRAIAADTTAELAEPSPRASRVYPVITIILLTVGWYVLPIIGWLAGIAMIFWGEGWTRAERGRAILWTVVAAVASFAVLLIFRGTALWMVGLGVVLVAPLVANIFCAAYLRRRWNPSRTVAR